MYHTYLYVASRPIAHLSSVHSPPPSSSYDALLREKENLEEAFEAFRQEVMITRQGNASKELRILKKVIKNLEVCVAMKSCGMCGHYMASYPRALSTVRVHILNGNAPGYEATCSVSIIPNPASLLAETLLPLMM